MTTTTWGDIFSGDVVRLKGEDWTVTHAAYGYDADDAKASVVVTIERAGRVAGPRTMDAGLPVERVDPTIGETVRQQAGELAAAEAVAQVQLGAMVIGRRTADEPWQVVGVDETMIHAHLYTFHGIDVVAVGSAAEAMALHLADHAAPVKAGAFIEHEHVA